MKSPQPDNIWVVIPALNAEETLAQVIRGIRSVCGQIPIVVVNDASDDATEEVARRMDAAVVHHETNRGFGASVKSGVRFACEQNAQTFLIIGADNQRDPHDIHKLFAIFFEKKSDIVIGSKFLGEFQPMPFLRKTGNQILTVVFNVLFNARFTDITSGFRIFNKKVAEDLDGLHDRYPFDADLCVRILRRGWRWEEVPVKVFYKPPSSRMKSVLLTGLAILSVILRRRFFV